MAEKFKVGDLALVKELDREYDNSTYRQWLNRIGTVIKFDENTGRDNRGIVKLSFPLHENGEYEFFVQELELIDESEYK